MIAVKKFEPETDYGVVCNWWSGHGWPEVPINALSDDGFVAMYDNNPIAAVWAFTTNNSLMAWVEWLISNPKADPRVAKACLLAVVKAATEHCKQNGHAIIMGHTSNEGLARRSSEFGYTRSKEKMNNLIYTGEF